MHVAPRGPHLDLSGRRISGHCLGGHNCMQRRGGSARPPHGCHSAAPARARDGEPACSLDARTVLQQLLQQTRPKSIRERTARRADACCFPRRRALRFLRSRERLLALRSQPRELGRGIAAQSGDSSLVLLQHSTRDGKRGPWVQAAALCGNSARDTTGAPVWRARARARWSASAPARGQRARWCREQATTTQRCKGGMRTAAAATSASRSRSERRWACTASKAHAHCAALRASICAGHK